MTGVDVDAMDLKVRTKDIKMNSMKETQMCMQKKYQMIIFMDTIIQTT